MYFVVGQSTKYLIHSIIVSSFLVVSGCTSPSGGKPEEPQLASKMHDSELCKSDRPSAGNYVKVYVVRRKLLNSDDIAKLMADAFPKAKASYVGFEHGIEVDYLVESLRPDADPEKFTIGDTKAANDLLVNGESYSKKTQSDGRPFDVVFVILKTADFSSTYAVNLNKLPLITESRKVIVQAIYMGSPPPKSGPLRTVLDVGWNYETERHFFMSDLACFTL